MSETTPEFPIAKESPVTKDLLHTRPYPLAHFTSPAIATRGLIDGLFSTAYARDHHEVFVEKSRWQSENGISVTDPEGLIKEESVKDPIQLATNIYGVGNSEASDTYQTGGVCLLIDPSIERFYGGDMDAVDRENADTAMLSEHYANQVGGKVKYGGGYRGEAVVKYFLPPSEVKGVVLSNKFKDSNIATTLEDKLATLADNRPNDLLRIFNDEVCLLRALKLIPEDLNEVMHTFQGQFQKAKALASIHDPQSIYHMFGVINLPENPNEYQKHLHDEYKQKLNELNSILESNEYRETSEQILNEITSKLPTALENLGVKTYSQLILHFAKEQNVPVYNNQGTVIEA